MSTEAAEDGSFSVNPEGERSTVINQAEFWLKLHDLYERVAAVVKQLTQNLKSERLRGPDPDYDSIDERFNTMWRAILRTPGNNGDSGPSLWQIFVSVALPLGLAMGGMWLHLSEKSDTQTIATAAQFAALQTSLADFKENQRIENERNNQRTTDLERAVRQLAADRWNGNARSGP